jgi:rhomboid family protein
MIEVSLAAGTRRRPDGPSSDIADAYFMTPWVRRLLVLNVAAFILTSYVLPPRLVNELVLVPALLVYRPWTIVTYQFLHANFLHILFNMIALFFFGPRLEARIGSRHFLLLYLISGASGAVLSLATPYAAIIGASGSVFGVLVGFARYWPRERIYIYALIPVEARFLVIFLAALSIWSGFSGGGNIAHFAHLGGFLGGWVYLKLLERSSPARKFKMKVETAGVSARASGRDLKRWENLDVSALHPINRQEYERLLQKAREHGVPSLTPQERAFMERFLAG